MLNESYKRKEEFVSLNAETAENFRNKDKKDDDFRNPRNGRMCKDAEELEKGDTEFICLV